MATGHCDLLVVAKPYSHRRLRLPTRPSDRRWEERGTLGLAGQSQHARLAPDGTLLAAVGDPEPEDADRSAPMVTTRSAVKVMLLP